MDMHDWGSWGMGMGWAGILFWIIVILAIVALVKYILSGPGR